MNDWKKMLPCRYMVLIVVVSLTIVGVPGLHAFIKSVGLDYGTVADWLSGCATAIGVIFAYIQMNIQHKDERESIEEMRREYKKEHEPHPEIYLYVVSDKEKVKNNEGITIGYTYGGTYHLESNLFNTGGGCGIYRFYGIIGMVDFDRYKADLTGLKNAVSSNDIALLISVKDVEQELAGVRASDFKAIDSMHSTPPTGFELDTLSSFGKKLKSEQDKMVIVYEDIQGNLIYKYFELKGNEAILHPETFTLDKKI